jgi:hypothetical protein
MTTYLLKQTMMMKIASIDTLPPLPALVIKASRQGTTLQQLSSSLTAPFIYWPNAQLSNWKLKKAERLYEYALVFYNNRHDDNYEPGPNPAPFFITTAINNLGLVQKI